MASAELSLYAPGALDAKVEYCKLLADSGLLPDAYRRQPANVLYAVEYGEVLGIPAMAAITGIHIIKGKPSASAGLVGALVRKAGHKLRVKGDDISARAVIVRSDDPGFEFVSEWTLERAVTAKLCTLNDGKPYARDSKGDPTSWEKYPAAMLKHRAVTEVARDACEEVLFGLHYTPEELGAEVDAEGAPVITVQQERQESAFTPQDAAEAVVRKEQREREHNPEASKDQRTKLIILMKEKFGLEGEKDRGKRLVMMSKHLKREITSFNDLTAPEAHGAIEALAKLDDYIADAETVPDPEPQPEMPAAPTPVTDEPQDGQDFHLVPSVGPEGICVDMESAIAACVDRAELEFVGQRITELADKHVLHEPHLKRLDTAWRAKSAELAAGQPERNGWSHDRLVASGLAS
jgi:hypothetical protein